MHMQIDAALNRQLSEDSDLSHPDYVVLVTLTAQPGGRLRISELAQASGWEKSRTSHHLARMARRGLVEKEACESDRRGAFVVITARGREVIEAAAPGHVAIVRRLVVDRLDTHDLDVLARVTETVLAALAEETGTALAIQAHTPVREDRHVPPSDRNTP
jgi:DNA-binding MarR family transcriptional regulator